MERVKDLLFHWWLGLSLATLFFYPLISALTDRSFYLHWEHDNTLELFTAMMAGGAVMGLLLFLIETYIESNRGKLVLTQALVVVPVLSAVAYIAWQLGIDAWVKTVSEGIIPFVKYSLIGFLIAGLSYLSWRYHEVIRRPIITAILVISPLNVFAGVTVVRAGYSGPLLMQHAPVRSEPKPVKAVQTSIFVLLFDELDPGFLYKDGEVREAFPNIKAFAAMADNYHNAISPGSETLIAIPSILGGRKVKVNDRQGVNLYEVSDTGTMSPLDIAGTSIFSLARSRGFKGVIYGWMFPYCEVLKGYIDECQAFSIYNYATVNDSFSIVNPILTNIILSPHSIPVGFLKTSIYSELHHQVASRIYDLAVSSLSTEDPVFEFIHFNLPHSPFVYDGVRYNPASDPWLQNEENYVKQLKYVDHLVGQFQAAMEKYAQFSTSHVVIMSDHGYRAMAPKGEAYHVPLLIKRAGQSMRRDSQGTVRTEVILRDLVMESVVTAVGN